MGIEKEAGLSPESKMVVLHDFTPCVDDELEVKRGQVIHHHQQHHHYHYDLDHHQNQQQQQDYEDILFILMLRVIKSNCD